VASNKFDIGHGRLEKLRGEINGRELSLEGILDSLTQWKNVSVTLNVPRRG
jgi:hypothetical protein